MRSSSRTTPKEKTSDAGVYSSAGTPCEWLSAATLAQGLPRLAHQWRVGPDVSIIIRSFHRALAGRRRRKMSGILREHQGGGSNT